MASIRNAYNTLELATRVDTDVRGLVVTKSGTGAAPTASRIAEFLGYVPADDAVPHSQDNGLALVDYAPRSGAAIASRKIADTLLEDGDTNRTEVPPARPGGPSGEAHVLEGTPGEHRSDDRSHGDATASTGMVPAELAELVEADTASARYADTTARERDEHRERID